MTQPREPQAPASPEEPVGALVHRLSEQIPELVRSEIRLAQAEMTQKGKRLGLGVGMFSAAGLLAFLGIQVLIATAILALALVLPAWLSALIIGAVLLLAAGVAAVLGKGRVDGASPVKPERATEGVREDIATVKGGHQ